MAAKLIRIFDESNEQIGFVKREANLWIGWSHCTGQTKIFKTEKAATKFVVDSSVF